MPTPNPATAKFLAWTLQDAEKAVAALKVEASVDAVKFYEGDHWQAQKGWIGPSPAMGELDYQLIMSAILRAFTSRNAVKEVVNRHRGAVVGIEPSWALVPIETFYDPETGEELPPSDELIQLITEAEDLLIGWWDRRKIHKLIQRVVALSLAGRRSLLRLYLPRGLFQVSGTGASATITVPSGPIVEQIARIFIASPSIAGAAIVRDPETMTEVAVVIYRPDGSDSGPQVAEISWVDGEETIIRTVGASGASEVRYRMGGRLPMYQLEEEPFITDQVMQLQRALNLALTTIPVNLTAANWLERVMLNAQAPGAWEYDEQNRPIPGTFKPRPYVTGPNTTNFVSGIPIQELDGQGNPHTTITTPQVQYREPGSLEGSTNGVEALYGQILAEVDQQHVLLAGEAMPSGKSREQARADFRLRLSDTRGGVEPAIQWLLESLLAMAEHFGGAPGRFTSKLRAIATCRLDLGPLSQSEREADASAVDKRLLPREEAMERLGVVDVDAAIARIDADPESQIAFKSKQLEAIAKATQAGVSLEGAVEFLGIEGDDADSLLMIPEFSGTVPGGDVVDEDTAPPDDNEPPPSGGDSVEE